MQLGKLNLGSGDKFLSGYINIDRKFNVAIEDTWDKVPFQCVRGEVFPLTDRAEASVDEVRASHVLEHFPHHQTLDVLREWVRVLKPGGCLKVAVPDFDRIVAMYDDGTDPLVESYLMGGHADADDRHAAIFNEQKLRNLLRLVGLTGVRPWTSDINDCASLPVSLNLMGFKPTAAAAALDGVHAVLSMPRLAFTDHAVCMLETTSKLKVPVRVRQGVFWGQTLTLAIEQSLDAGARYVLAVDYDTVFSPEDVVELYRLLEANPDVGAVFATQIGRDRNTPLLTVRKTANSNRDHVTRAEADADLLTASTGHFGLTLIRRKVFEQIRKPWFLHEPDAANAWGDGRVDEDIHFWRMCEDACVRVCQANHVRVGHLQLVVTWPTPDFAPLHQYVGDYRRDGRPPEVNP